MPGGRRRLTHSARCVRGDIPILELTIYVAKPAPDVEREDIANLSGALAGEALDDAQIGQFREGSAVGWADELPFTSPIVIKRDPEEIAIDQREIMYPFDAA
jgi:hypothetical protein